MTREKFLTTRWNNILSLVLGLPGLIFVIYAFSTSLWTERGGIIGMAIIGALYCPIVETHTAMRFNWLRKQKSDYVSHIQPITHPLGMIRFAYNLVYWVILLPFVGLLDYRTGFVLFTIVIFVRLFANIYANNIMQQTPEKYDSLPLRIPIEAN